MAGMSALKAALLSLQILHVAFLALHDWIPLGRLNDLEAVKRANPNSRLAVATILSTAPFAFALIESVLHAHQPFPHWLVQWLWWSYGLLFLGELRAWWAPYFFGAKPGLVDRYEVMFGKTTAFLPRRNGLQPNTLHVVLHATTLLTLVVLAIATSRSGW
jgi:hypothetical protein